MKHLFLALFLAVTASSATLVHAHGYRVDDLEIIHPHARPSRPGVLNSSAYFGVRNTGNEADRIVGISSQVANHTELHDMATENDVMRMFPVDAVDIPAGQTVKLGDGNHLHVMLLELKQPLKVGDKFPLVIDFEHAGSITVEVWVEDGQAAQHSHGAHDDHHSGAHGASAAPNGGGAGHRH